MSVFFSIFFFLYSTRTSIDVNLTLYCTVFPWMTSFFFFFVDHPTHSTHTVTNILYAFAGHWLYFELIAVMRVPARFPKVFIVNAPIQLLLYLVVACTGYYYQGQVAQGYFLDNLPKGELYRFASILLYAHVVVVYLLKSVVLARFFHSIVAPQRVDEETSRAKIEYGSFALCQLVVGCLIANAIPFFDSYVYK